MFSSILLNVIMQYLVLEVAILLSKLQVLKDYVYTTKSEIHNRNLVKNKKQKEE